MTRWRGITARVGRAEAAGGPATPPVPCIVTVGTHDTPRGALAAFAAAYPDRPRRHAPMVVPAKAIDADDFAARFKASQMALVRAARAEPIAPSVVASDAEPATERASINRAREVVAAAKVLVTKPTYSAANRLSHAERARLHGRPRLSN